MGIGDMLEEKILNDYKEAMKARDKLKSSTLSFLRAEMMNAAIEKKKKALDDSDVIAVIKKQIKQHQDSIEQFKAGNRQELVDKESGELEILKSYLPPQLCAEELRKIIEQIIKETSAQGPGDIGKVMKQAMLKTGQAGDGKLISDLVRELLSKLT